MWLPRPTFFLAALLTLSACAGVQPVVPRIERLPEGAAGAFAPAIARPLSLTEVVDMARGNTPSKVIIQLLRDSRATYAASSAEANELSRQGVPYEVIDYLRFGELRHAPLAVYPYSYLYPGYSPYDLMPGFYYPRRGVGRYSRYSAGGFSLRFGFRR